MRVGVRSHSKGLPFFLPSGLIDFEYFGAEGTDEEYDKLAKDYRQEIDFAFFVVNFGYSKTDYEALTRKEKAFIYKAWENKVVSDTTHSRNAYMNAYVNARRKKGKKLMPLWKKKQKKVNKDVAKDNLNLINEIEQKDGKSWIDLIYQGSGFKRKRKKGDGKNG